MSAQLKRIRLNPRAIASLAPPLRRQLMQAPRLNRVPSAMPQLLSSAPRIRQLSTSAKADAKAGAEGDRQPLVYGRELRVPAMVASDSKSPPRNACKLTQKQLDEISRSAECQRLMAELQKAVQSLRVRSKPLRADRLLDSDAAEEKEKGEPSTSLQFGWFKLSQGNTLKLRPHNFHSDYASVRAPLFALGALFGGFHSASVTRGSEFEVQAEKHDHGSSIAFTLGEFQGGKLIVDIPREKKGVCSARTSLNDSSGRKTVFADVSKGRALDVLRKPTLFDASQGYCTEPKTSGDRVFVRFSNRSDVPADCGRIVAMPPSASEQVPMLAAAWILH